MDLVAFKTEVADDADYKDLTFEVWDAKIQYRGFHRRSQKDFDQFEPMYLAKITELRSRLTDDWDFSCKVSDDGKVLKSDADILDAVKQKMDDWYYCQAKERRLFDKLACVVKEQELRGDELVIRTGIHDAVTRYMCLTPDDAGTITGTWTFTNGQNYIEALGADGNAQAEIDGGDYVRQSDGTAWYEVDGEPPTDDRINLVTNFQQATHTDDAGASRNADVSAMDGSTVGKAFVSMNQYTVTEGRTADDVLYIRANETHGTNGVDITADEDGTIDNYIKIIGCDDTLNDPWGDSSDAKPIIDFEDLSFQLKLGGEHYWYFERLDLRQSDDTYGMVWFDQCDGTYIKDCDFSDCAQAGIRLDDNWTVIDGCIFADLFTNNGQIYAVEGSYCLLKNSTFNHGPGIGSNYAVRNEDSTLFAIDCSFGDTTQFDNACFWARAFSTFYLRNCSYSGTFVSMTRYASIYSEDDDGTFEAQKSTFYHGIVERDTAVVHSGGADSSAKLTPNAYCGPNELLTIHGYDGGQHDFAVWAAASVEITVTVYARVGSAWDSALAAAECYMKTSHLSNAGTAARTETQSSETIANDGTWTALTTTITPAREGWVYVTFFLAEYEDATEHVLVDIKPTAVAT